MIVFSLNTIIGFSCAVGMDMGFNSTHHHDEESTETPVHIHANGKSHNHHNEVTKPHEEASKDHHHSNEGKDNCCNDQVVKLSQLDKSVPGSSSTINPIFFIAFLSLFYNSDILFHSLEPPGIKYYVRSHHPPIPDIRIAIQSFQI